MTAYLSAKEAKRLGIDASGPAPEAASAPRRKVIPYHTRCRKCREEFTTMAAESRHMKAEGHLTFELVLE